MVIKVFIAWQVTLWSGGGCFMLSPHLLPDKNESAESMSRIGIWIDAVGFRSGSGSLNSWLVPIPSLAMPYQYFNGYCYWTLQLLLLTPPLLLF